MTELHTEIKKIPGSQIEITAEIPAEDFERAYKHTFDAYNKETNIAGFRPGHVPEDILRGKIGEDIILQEAARDSIGDWYIKFLSEKKIDAIGHPQVTITKIARKNPLGIRLTTAVLPDIELPDYRAIAKKIMEEKYEIIVEDKEIDETLEHLKNVKRKAKSEKHDDEQKEIQLDDEFAKSVGQFETFTELREAVRSNLHMEKEMKKREEKRMAVLDEVSKQTKIDMPDIMVVAEKEKMIEELKGSLAQMGMKWDDYLSHVKKTEDEIKNGWNDQAQKRVLYGLLLRAIAEKEGITVSDEEVKEYMEKIKAQYPADRQKDMSEDRMEHYAASVIKNEKTFQALEKV